MKRIPTNWNEITFGDYIKTLAIKDIPEGLNEAETVIYNMRRSVELIAILTGSTTDKINAMQSSTVLDYVKSLSFMSKEIPNIKTNHKVKKIEDISYENFVDYINYSRSENAIHNLPKILTIFIKDITEVEVLELPTDYVFSCFFLLKKSAKRYWRYSLFKTMKQIIYLKIKESLSYKKRKTKSN